MGGPPPDHASQALQGVNRRVCGGWGRLFLPTRHLVHCRPACRGLSGSTVFGNCASRRAGHESDALAFLILATGGTWGLQ
jgi:hypothetical protein